MNIKNSKEKKEKKMLEKKVNQTKSVMEKSTQSGMVLIMRENVLLWHLSTSLLREDLTDTSM